jgi:hypothetical protein
MIANAFGHTGGEYGFGTAREVHCHPLEALIAWGGKYLISHFCVNLKWLVF